jgi:tape measure domain-containing protein
MALNLGSMFAWIGADTSGLDKAESRMKKFVSNIKGQQGGLEKSALSLGKVLAGVISFETLRRGAMLADEYKLINARIKNATKEFKSYYAVQKQVQSIAMNTGGNYNDTSKLYINIQRAAPEIGATQKQALQLTDTLNKLGVISGASTTEMKNGMLQFGQAMAGGILRAEEFNSIIENIPEVANRIAKGLGMTVGQLRLAVLDGKVLSKDVFASLLKQSDQVNKDFAEMPMTMGRGMESMKTGGMSFLAQLDEQLGMTNMIASTFQGIGEYLAQDFSTTLFDVVSYFTDIYEGLKTWKDMVTGIKDAYASLGGDSQTWAEGIHNVQWGLDWVLTAIKQIGPNVKFMFNMITTWIADLMITIKNGFAIMDELQAYFWEHVKAWGAQVAAYLLDKFSGVISSLMSFFGEWIGNNADIFGMFGFDDLEQKVLKAGAAMQKSSADVKAYAAGVKQGAEEMAAGADKHLDAIEGIVKQQELEREASRELKEQHAAQYEADLAGIEQARAAREQAHKEKLDQRAKDEAAAEEAFKNEQAREAAIIAPKAKRVKEPKDKTDQIRKQIESRLMQVQQGLMSELELENQHYAESLAALNQAEAMKIASIMPYHELRERLEQQHQENLAAIERARFEKRMQQASDFFGNLATLQDSENKKMAKIGKAAAVAQAVVNTYTAATGAYASLAMIPYVGPALGAAAAAAAIVAGYQNIAQIRAAKATGGGVGMGGMYKVNEQGPELLNVGGEDFLMMGSQGGHITPNHLLGGGGDGGSGPIIVNLYTLPGQTATVEQTGEREVTIRMAVDQAKKEITKEAGDGSGTVVPAILKAGGMRRKAS